MKNYITLALICTLLLASCGSDDDNNGGSNANAVFFENTQVSIDETEGTATFTVRYNGNINQPFTVNYETRDGSANQPIDYTAASGSLSFSGNNGERKNISININRDVFREDMEDFTLRLTQTSNTAVSLGADNTATAQIVDDIDIAGNLLATGASANDILSNNNFDKLLIQVAYVEGFRPTAETMDNFTEFLQEHTFKQDIEIVYLELPSPGETTLELQEIADLEAENRTVFNNNTTTETIYIYFADAPSEGDDEDEGLVTLGAVYRNTSMVIFERTIRNLAGRSAFINNTDVETATLNHEFGHLFGLVNLGTAAVNDHEDPNAANHCNVNGCLMRAELQFGSPSGRLMGPAAKLQSACSLSGTTVMQLLENRAAMGNGIVPGLDPECVLDLQSNGGR